MLNEKQFRFSGAYLFDEFLWDEFLDFFGWGYSVTSLHKVEIQFDTVWLIKKCFRISTAKLFLKLSFTFCRHSTVIKFHVKLHKIHLKSSDALPNPWKFSMLSQNTSNASALQQLTFGHFDHHRLALQQSTVPQPFTHQKNFQLIAIIMLIRIWWWKMFDVQ